MTSLLRSLSSLFTLLHSLRSMLGGSDSAGHPRADQLLDQATAARVAGRACERVPENLAVAVALGRVYFELEMLDEAAEQFEKIEVRAPDMPIVHAFVGAT